MSNLYSKDNMRYDDSVTIRKRHDHKAASNEEFVSDVFFKLIIIKELIQESTIYLPSPPRVRLQSRVFSANFSLKKGRLPLN